MLHGYGLIEDWMGEIQHSLDQGLYLPGVLAGPVLSPGVLTIVLLWELLVVSELLQLDLEQFLMRHVILLETYQHSTLS
jgi:hypothetical protein